MSHRPCPGTQRAAIQAVKPELRGRAARATGSPAVAWLVRRGYARTRMEALRRVHAETLVFLMLDGTRSSAWLQGC
jgi:hypothetical protein